jgi:hypothetical protein
VRRNAVCRPTIYETTQNSRKIPASQYRAPSTPENDYFDEPDDLKEYLATGVTYILSEHLIGLTYVEAMRFPGSPVAFRVPQANRSEQSEGSK